MINPVHQLLLARLDATPSPTLSLRELSTHAEPLWRPLITAGVLAEADTPEEIEVSHRTVAVKKIGETYFGFDTAEEFPAPRRLSRDNLTTYRVIVPGLVAYLRTANAIDGRTSNAAPAAAALHFIGRKSMPGGIASVWLATALGSPDASAGRLAMLIQEDAHAQHIVVFPIWPELPAATMSALSAKGVFVVDLDPSSLAIRWPASFTTEAVPETPDCALTCNGATWRIDYLGETINVLDSIGVNYIALLMSTPEGTWTPFELQAGRRTSDAGTDDALNQGLSVVANTQNDLPRASSVKASAVAELTLRRFAQEIEKLQDGGREAEAAELQEKASIYADENAHLLGAHSRSSFVGDREKARLAVRANIERALKSIEGRSAPLGRVIRDRVHLSTPLSFNPARGESWMVRLPKEIRTSRPKSRK